MTNYSSGGGRRYGWNRRTILLNFVSLIFIIPALGLTVLILWLFRYTLRDSRTLIIGFMMIICLSPFLLVIVVTSIWHLINIMGRPFFSFLKITPSGLEYRNWPYYWIRCEWKDIERLGTYRVMGLFPYDVLFLTQAEPLGWQITMKLRRFLGLSQQHIVSLSGMKGWPNGELAHELDRYIPNIMIKK